jgi:hypothetical protein
MCDIWFLEMVIVVMSVAMCDLQVAHDVFNSTDTKLATATRGDSHESTSATTFKTPKKTRGLYPSPTLACQLFF